MGLNSLSTAGMVSLTGSWVVAGHPDRRALERIPAVAALLPYVDAAHEALLSSQRNLEQERLARISVLQADMDRLHDDLARGVWYGMEACKYLVQNAELAEKIGKAQSVLFPNGLRVVQYGYREAAGQGALLAARLGPELEALLASLPVQGGTLLDQVHAWIAAARRLGELENERTRLAAARAPGSAARARSRWIRTIQAVRAVIDLEGSEDPQVLRLLQRITTAAAAADRRRRGGEDVGDVEEAGDVNAAPVDGQVPAEDAVPADGVDAVSLAGEAPAEDGDAELRIPAALLAARKGAALPIEAPG